MQVYMERHSDRRAKVSSLPGAWCSCLKTSETDSRRSEDALRTDTFEDGIQNKIAAVPYSAMQFPFSTGPQGWKKRPRSPDLKGYKEHQSL